MEALIPHPTRIVTKWNELSMEFEDRFYLSLPFFLRVLLGILVIGLVIAYALFQARHLISGPTISLIEDIPSVISTSTIIVHGKAENIISLSLNGKPIFTTDEGVFKEVVTLPSGYTILTIEAVDRYGARTRLERNIVRE